MCAAKTHRLFVGNLPENLIEQELKNEFASYGRVKDVELKHKRNADEQILNTFAFIQIELDGAALRQCLQEFKTEKFRGRFLNVTVARENFLDKLKREREEAAARGEQSTPAAAAPIELVATRPALPTLATVQRQTADNAAESSSSEESSSSDDDEKPAAPTPAFRRTVAVPPPPAKPTIPDEELDEDGNLLRRKRSKAFLENGRIRIDAGSGTGGAIHVIERNRKEAKTVLDGDKSKAADKKRMESLGKMKEAHDQKKLAIKMALSGVDTQQRANKIVFDVDPSVAAASAVASAKKQPSKPAQSGAGNKPLFDDDDEAEDYTNDFRIKEQFEGERGAKLMQLQSRFRNDKRFEMDTRFLEDPEDGDEDAGAEWRADPPVAAAATGEDDERAWQYGILESVMGKKIQSEPTAAERKSNLPPTMLRYDPTKQDHSKYLAQGKRKAELSARDAKAKKSKQEEAEQEEIAAKPEFEVTKDQFYKVNKSLAFGDAGGGGGGGGFSLLSMFGSAHVEQPAANRNATYKETLLTTNSTQKTIEDMTNPFQYDTSDDERGEVKGKKKTATATTAAAGKTAGKAAAAKKPSAAVWHETFFILDADDERMKEGLAFFMPAPATEAGDEAELEKQQKEMRNILKKKVKRSIKSALPQGAKPNKRFRKFVRNL